MDLQHLPFKYRPPAASPTLPEKAHTMPSIHPTKPRLPGGTRRRDGRSWRGGLMGFGAISLGLVITYLLAPDWVADHEFFSPPAGRGTPLREGPARTGSILVTSLNQDTCRLRSFDNMSGSQWDFGVVDCRDAILQSRQGPSMDRMNAITDAFRPK
jgi:hypothetical protein